jgi:hypothetical protein
MVSLDDIMGWINIYVLLVELTFYEFKNAIPNFLICLNVLVSLRLHLSNMICISPVTKLSIFVK